ncbi:Rho GTPase activating protein, partial [Coemansia spiralis]
GLSKETDMFRHAFLIEEQPKREGRDTVAHPLWADSDRERDEWVMALRYVIVRDSDGPERAMKEVTKLVKHARSKESKPLMIHQIQTSLTHEQGARRSVEHTRQKEEEQQQQRSAAKFGSPLSKQMWPHNAPPDDAAGGASVLGIVAAPGLEAGPDANAGLPDTGAPSMRPSPAAIATSLSTSFAGYPESMSDQSERHSLHYVASEISTIESSIYSSYNGNSVGSRLNDVSSRSIDDRNSCASAPESPRSPVRPTGTAAPRAAASDYWAPSASHAGARPGAPALAPVAAQTRVQFTKNSVGRIVHEEETVPDLPQITPRVTDDILGVGRQKPGRSDQAGSGSDGPTRS